MLSEITAIRGERTALKEKSGMASVFRRAIPNPADSHFCSVKFIHMINQLLLTIHVAVLL